MEDVDSSATDVVVGCIAGLNFERIAPWVGSLDACGFTGRRVVIHLNTDAETIAELNRHNYETYDASCLHGAGPGNFKENPQNDEISVNRFYYIWHFLYQFSTRPYPRYLISVDTSDLVFQRNPSLWLERHLGKKRLVVGSESIRFEDEAWNTQMMKDSFGHQVWEAHRREFIYNGGTIAGEFRTMMDLCLQIFLLAPGNRVHYSDQPALNVLIGSGVYRDITCFATSEDAWACQAGTTADPLLLETVRHCLACPAPTFDGEFVRTAGGEVFTMVHQYDRVPEWNIPLKNKYTVLRGSGNTVSPPQ